MPRGNSLSQSVYVIIYLRVIVNRLRDSYLLLPAFPAIVGRSGIFSSLRLRLYRGLYRSGIRSTLVLRLHRGLCLGLFLGLAMCLYRGFVLRLGPSGSTRRL